MSTVPSPSASRLQCLHDLLRDPAVREGMRDMRAVSLGVSAWGLVTGVAMVKSGLSVWLALAINLLVFAGSAQLTALPLIAAGAPIWMVVAAAFFVNLRFVVFSAQIRPYLEHLRLPRRLLQGYLIGDLNQVLMIRRHPHPTGDPAQAQYYLGASITNWIAWQVPSISGILLAQWIPTSWGLGFAGALALLGIVLSLLADKGMVLVIVLASAVATLLFWLPIKLNLAVAIACALLAGMIWDDFSSRRAAGTAKLLNPSKP